MSSVEEMGHDFIVGFTLFTRKGFKTMYRHFDKLETAKMFTSNVNIKNNCKIYVGLDFHKDEMKNLIEENKELKTITNQYESYECEAPKDSIAKIIIADKFYFNNGYFKDNFIEIEKIKAKIEELNKRENVGIADIFEDMKEYAIQVLQELLKEGEEDV